MEIYKSEFVSAYFDAASSILTQVWSDKSIEMNEDAYKTEILNYVQQLETYQAKKTLADLSEFNYTIVPELQDWHAKTVFPYALKQSNFKAAMILPHDLFSQVSIEQTIEEGKDIQFQSKYFDNEADAINWLNS